MPIAVVVASDRELRSCLPVVIRLGEALQQRVHLYLSPACTRQFRKVARRRIERLAETGCFDDSSSDNNASAEDCEEETQAVKAAAQRMKVTQLEGEDEEVLQTLNAKSINLLLLPRVEKPDTLEHLLYRKASASTAWLQPGNTSKPWQGIAISECGDGATTALAEPLTAGPAAGAVVKFDPQCAAETFSAGDAQFVQQELKRNGLGSDTLLVLSESRNESRLKENKSALATLDALAEYNVLIIRRGDSTLERICDRFWQRYRRIVPQLDRPARQELAEALENGSRLSFDFVALITASTILASFGLVMNSAAVIIGAMLIAPLMTPILGSGLALVYANFRLFRRACVSIAVAMGLALLASFLFGLVARLTLDAHTSSEMAARSSPMLLDFFIALVGGGAAAYAHTRKNLSSALAGAAIAAALVPPLATSGLQMAFLLMPGNPGVMTGWPVAGPLLLFVVNALTIMVASAISMWSCGIRGSHNHGVHQPWATRMLVLILLAISACLTVFMWLAMKPAA